MRMLLGAMLLLAGSAHALVIPPFISEIHYDNVGADIDEFVEIVGAGVDLAGWALRFYNGASGEIYRSLGLAGNLDDQELVAIAFFPAFSIQNGPADGLALIDMGGSVRDFIAYEGGLVAQDGEAAGMLARQLPVAESASTPPGQSLQREHLMSPGNWRLAAATPNRVNSGMVAAPPAAWLALTGIVLLQRVSRIGLRKRPV